MIRVTLSKESLSVRVRTMHVELGKKGPRDTFWFFKKMRFG